MPGITVSNGDITAIPNPDEGEQDPEIDFLGGLKQIWDSTGLKQGTWQQYAMLAVACLLLYLAIVKGFEPLLLLPIAFGMLLSNLPMGGLMSDPVYKVFTSAEKAAQYGAYYGKSVEVVLNSSGKEVYQVLYQNGGLLHYLYKGVKLGIYPPLIFMGVGAMTDFGPLMANPKSLLLGAAAQLGIFLAFLIAQAHRPVLRLLKRPPSASSAARTAPRPSSLPPAWRPICWAPSPWPPIATWPWFPSSSRPS